MLSLPSKHAHWSSLSVSRSPPLVYETRTALSSEARSALSSEAAPALLSTARARVHSFSLTLWRARVHHSTLLCVSRINSQVRGSGAVIAKCRNGPDEDGSAPLIVGREDFRKVTSASSSYFDNADAG